MDSGQQNGSNISGMIWTVGTPLVFFVGIVGNIFTIIVLTINRQNRSSTSVYLTVLATADLLVMTISLPRWWLIYTFGVDIRHLSNGLCKLQWFMTYFDSTLSISILATVTIERVISTVKPYQMKKMCTVTSALTISGIIVAVALLINSHVLFGFTLFETDISNNSTRADDTHLVTGNTSDMEQQYRNCTTSGQTVISNCTTQITNNDTLLNEGKGLAVTLVKICWLQNPNYMKFYNKPFQVITILLLNVIPEFIFLVGGIIIVRKLATVQRRVGVEQLGPDRNQQNIRADRHSRQITLTLLLVNIVFFICTTPVLIFLVNRSAWVDSERGMTETQEILWAVFNLMFYTNHAVNFILYFLSGKRFRKQVIAVLKCKKTADRHTVTSRSQASTVM